MVETKRLKEQVGWQQEAQILLLQQAVAATRLEEVQAPRRTMGRQAEGVTRRVKAVAPLRLGAVVALQFDAATGPGLAEGRPDPRLAWWPICRGLGGSRWRAFRIFPGAWLPSSCQTNLFSKPWRPWT